MWLHLLQSILKYDSAVHNHHLWVQHAFEQSLLLSNKSERQCNGLARSVLKKKGKKGKVNDKYSFEHSPLLSNKGEGWRFIRFTALKDFIYSHHIMRVTQLWGLQVKISRYCNICGFWSLPEWELLNLNCGAFSTSKLVNDLNFVQVLQLQLLLEMEESSHPFQWVALKLHQN